MPETSIVAERPVNPTAVALPTSPLARAKTWLVRPWVTALLTLVGIVAILFWRKPQAFLNPQFWAEDAGFFFVLERALGIQSIFKPGGGYMVVLQHLISIPGGLVQMEWLPTYYLIGTLACILTTGYLILSARIDARFRWLMALALVLVSHNGEVFLGMANLMWMVFPALMIMALQDNPTSRGRAAFELSALFILGLTGPYCIMYLPLLLLRPLVFGRTRYNWAFAGIALTAAVIQVLYVSVFVAETGSMAAGGGGTMPPLWNMTRYFLTTYLGYYFLGAPFPTRWQLMILAAVLLGAAYLLFTAPKKIRLYMLVLGGSAGLMYVSGMIRINLGNYPYVHPWLRYFYAAGVMLAWYCVLGLSIPRRSSRVVAGALCALMLCAMLQHPKCDVLTDYHWREQCAVIRAAEARGETCKIMVNPNWEVEVTPRGQPVGGLRVLSEAELRRPMR